MSVLAKRLKQARLEAGYSQENLGRECGIDEMSASARMNQYERGVHSPSFAMVERFGEVLNQPVEFFYARDDSTADLLTKLHRIPEEKRKAVLISFIQLLDPSSA